MRNNISKIGRSQYSDSVYIQCDKSGVTSAGFKALKTLKAL